VMARAGENVRGHHPGPQARRCLAQGFGIVHAAGIGDDRVDADARGDISPGLEVAHGTEVLGLARLRASIEQQDPLRGRFPKGRCQLRDEHVGKDARKPGTWSDDDVRSVAHGHHSFGAGARLHGAKTQPHDAAMCRRESRLASDLDRSPVDRLDISDELDRLQAVRKHASTCPEHVTETIESCHEVTCLVPERHEDEVAKRVPLDVARSAESVLEDPCPQALLRERSKSHPEIAGRGYAQMCAEPATGATVIAGADDGRGLNPDSTQGSQRDREAMASTQGDDGGRHSRPRSRWTTTDSIPCLVSLPATSSVNATLRCLPPVHPTATVT